VYLLSILIAGLNSLLLARLSEGIAPRLGPLHRPGRASPGTGKLGDPSHHSVAGRDHQCHKPPRRARRRPRRARPLLRCQLCRKSGEPCSPVVLTCPPGGDAGLLKIQPPSGAALPGERGELSPRLHGGRSCSGIISAPVRARPGVADLAPRPADRRYPLGDHPPLISKKIDLRPRSRPHSSSAVEAGGYPKALALLYGVSVALGLSALGLGWRSENIFYQSLSLVAVSWRTQAQRLIFAGGHAIL
jgi:hypothetical protein